VQFYSAIMKISLLCKMIEDSIHDMKYPIGDQQQHLAKHVQVINESGSEDLKNEDIKIKVRIENVYTINNYIPNIEHLPGIIEMDVLDSFKMLCRRLARVQKAREQADTHMKNIRIATNGYTKTELNK
jgi:desulfoferrodoxin (superoxide reductase-like protein)